MACRNQENLGETSTNTDDDNYKVEKENHQESLEEIPAIDSIEYLPAEEKLQVKLEEVSPPRSSKNFTTALEDMLAPDGEKIVIKGENLIQSEELPVLDANEKLTIPEKDFLEEIGAQDGEAKNESVCNTCQIIFPSTGREWCDKCFIKGGKNVKNFIGYNAYSWDSYEDFKKWQYNYDRKKVKCPICNKEMLRTSIYRHQEIHDKHNYN